ncbi:hypothetical protein [Asticcacaulis excentricus]|uniref:hypothetical protein n=1 Tax=Asticcacaulis excentricus TaxID=78587 RepID=UPI000F81BE34|nr:hypothetical protein [Asticcacaulis excentricus]
MLFFRSTQDNRFGIATKWLFAKPTGDEADGLISATCLVGADGNELALPNEADVGNKTDPAAVSDTGDFSIIAFLKRISFNISGVLSRVPALGVGTLGGSVPVNMASSVAVQTVEVQGGAITTTTTSSAITPVYGGAGSYQCMLAVTSVSGTNPTLDVVIEESEDGSNWYHVYQFERVTGAGIYRSPRLPMRGLFRRFVRTVAGTTPSFNCSVRTIERPFDRPPTRFQAISRVVDPTVVNSTTPTYNIEGCSRIQISVQATLGANFTIALAGSQNGANFAIIGSVNVTGSGATPLYHTTGLWKFVRVFVQSAGAGSTIDNISIAAQE